MKKILLIEDDPFIVDIYTTKLKESNFDVNVLTDGSDFLERIKEIKPDLLLLDIVLPQVDGWEILREIRSDPKIKNLKVIVLSNLSQKSDVEKGMILGADKYLIKAHFTPSEIVEEIKKTI